MSSQSEIMIAGIAVVAAAFALFAWGLSVRVKHFEDLVKDASDALGDRGAYLSVVSEIEERSKINSPWLRSSMHEAVTAWIQAIGLNVRDSVAELAHRIGAEYFAKLLVAKGLELGVMEERIGSQDGRPRVEYDLVWIQEARI